MRRSANKRIQKITPFLWFDDKAEEAARFYTSIFSNSRVRKIARYGPEAEKASGRPAGSVMTVEFQLEGRILWRSTAARNSNLPLRSHS